MDVKVLGPGCPNCVNLKRNVDAALAQLGISVRVEKVTNMQEIMRYGIMRMPGLVVNGQVVVSGRVPSAAEIAGILRSAL